MSGQSVVVAVQVEGNVKSPPSPWLLEPDASADLGIEVADSLMQPDAEGQACAMLTNSSGFTQQVENGPFWELHVKQLW